MAYCTAEDVLNMVKEDMHDSILENQEFESDEAKLLKLKELIQEAIEDAGYEIDGYLGKRYSLPFTDTPKVLYKFAKDIAIYNLISRRGIDEDSQEKTILTRYNAAIKFLESVSKGTIEIGTFTPAKAASVGFKSQSNGRLFTRDQMKGY